MRTHIKTPLRAHCHRPARAFEIVSSVDVLQCRIITGFDAVLDDYKLALVPESLQQIQLGRVNAIGTCSYDYSHHVRMSQGLSIHLIQSVKGRVCVRIGLEVGQIMPGIPVSDLVESYALVKLTAYALARSTVIRVKCVIVAISAAAHPDAAVPVRAGESGINDKFLQALAIFFPEITDV